MGIQSSTSTCQQSDVKEILRDKYIIQKYPYIVERASGKACLVHQIITDSQAQAEEIRKDVQLYKQTQCASINRVLQYIPLESQSLCSEQQFHYIVEEDYKDYSLKQEYYARKYFRQNFQPREIQAVLRTYCICLRLYHGDFNRHFDRITMDQLNIQDDHFCQLRMNDPLLKKDSENIVPIYQENSDQPGNRKALIGKQKQKQGIQAITGAVFSSSKPKIHIYKKDAPIRIAPERREPKFSPGNSFVQKHLVCAELLSDLYTVGVIGLELFRMQEFQPHQDRKKLLKELAKVDYELSSRDMTQLRRSIQLLISQNPSERMCIYDLLKINLQDFNTLDKCLMNGIQDVFNPDVPIQGKQINFLAQPQYQPHSRFLQTTLPSNMLYSQQNGDLYDHKRPSQPFKMMKNSQNIAYAQIEPVHVDLKPLYHQNRICTQSRNGFNSTNGQISDQNIQGSINNQYFYPPSKRQQTFANYNSVQNNRIIRTDAYDISFKNMPLVGPGMTLNVVSRKPNVWNTPMQVDNKVTSIPSVFSVFNNEKFINSKGSRIAILPPSWQYSTGQTGTTGKYLKAEEYKTPNFFANSQVNSVPIYAPYKQLLLSQGVKQNHSSSNISHLPVNGNNSHTRQKNVNPPLFSSNIYSQIHQESIKKKESQSKKDNIGNQARQILCRKQSQSLSYKESKGNFSQGNIDSYKREQQLNEDQNPTGQSQKNIFTNKNQFSTFQNDEVVQDFRKVTQSDFMYHSYGFSSQIKGDSIQENIEKQKKKHQIEQTVSQFLQRETNSIKETEYFDYAAKDQEYGRQYKRVDVNQQYQITPFQPKNRLVEEQPFHVRQAAKNSSDISARMFGREAQSQQIDTPIQPMVSTYKPNKEVENILKRLGIGSLLYGTAGDQLASKDQDKTQSDSTCDQWKFQCKGHVMSVQFDQQSVTQKNNQPSQQDNQKRTPINIFESEQRSDIKYSQNSNQIRGQLSSGSEKQKKKSKDDSQSSNRDKNLQDSKGHSHKDSQQINQQSSYNSDSRTGNGNEIAGLYLLRAGQRQNLGKNQREYHLPTHDNSSFQGESKYQVQQKYQRNKEPQQQGGHSSCSQTRDTRSNGNSKGEQLQETPFVKKLCTGQQVKKNFFLSQSLRECSNVNYTERNMKQQTVETGKVGSASMYEPQIVANSGCSVARVPFFQQNACQGQTALAQSFKKYAQGSRQTQLSNAHSISLEQSLPENGNAVEIVAQPFADSNVKLSEQGFKAILSQQRQSAVSQSPTSGSLSPSGQAKSPESPGSLSPPLNEETAITPVRPPNRSKYNSTIVEAEEENSSGSSSVESLKREHEEQLQARREYVDQEYETGSRYEGYKLDGRRDGRGKFFYQDGGYYDGDWKDNKMHGWGRLYYEGGKLAYEGNWREDEFHGFGKVYNDNPRLVEGGFDFTNFDLLQEYWLYYEGMLVKDTKEGRGKIKLTNGEVFEGDFHNDRIQGFGKFTMLNPDRQRVTVEGIWRDSRLIKIIYS